MGLILNELFTKKIPDGVDYQLIKSISPLFWDLDEIVSSMLKNNINDRENNIENVINKIQHSLIKYKEDVNDIILDYENDLKKFNQNEKTIISEDLALVKIYFKSFDKEKLMFNHRYHSETFYPYTNNFSDSLKLMKIYSNVKEKFDFENSVINDEQITRKIEKTVYLEEFNGELNKLKYFNNGEMNLIKNKSLILFKSLKENHQYELLNRIRNDNYSSIGTVYDLLNDLNNLNKYAPIQEEISMNSFVNLPDKIEYNDEIFFAKNEEEIKKTYLVKKIVNYGITAFYENNRVLLISSDLKKIKNIMLEINNNLDKKNTYVDEGDLLDCKNIIEDLIQNSYAESDEFDFEYILCKKILQIDYYNSIMEAKEN